MDVNVGLSPGSHKDYLDVDNATVGILLGVDLAGEDLVGGDCGHHVGGAAVDGHIVAGAQLKSASHVPNHQEGILPTEELFRKKRQSR